MHPTNSPLLSRLVIVAARCVSLSKYATVQHCHYTYSAEFDSFTIPLHSSYVFSTVILLTVFGFCFWFRRPEQSLRSLLNEANSSVVPAVSTLIDLDQSDKRERVLIAATTDVISMIWIALSVFLNEAAKTD